MKTFTVVMSATAMVIGISGAALAYQSVSSQADSSEPHKVVSEQSAGPAVVSVNNPADSNVKVRFAPCKPPAKRVGRACVITTVKTVAVPATSTASSSSSGYSVGTSTTSSTATSASNGSDDQATSSGDDDQSWSDGDDQGDDGGQDGGSGNDQEPNDD